MNLLNKISLDPTRKRNAYLMIIICGIVVITNIPIFLCGTMFLIITTSLRARRIKKEMDRITEEKIQRYLDENHDK